MARSDLAPLQLRFASRRRIFWFEESNGTGSCAILPRRSNGCRRQQYASRPQGAKSCREGLRLRDEREIFTRCHSRRSGGRRRQILRRSRAGWDFLIFFSEPAALLFRGATFSAAI